MTSSRFAQSYCSSAPVRLRYICFAGIGHSNSQRLRKERVGTLFQDLSASRLLGHSVFVTPDLQLASPTHAPQFTQPLRKSFTASEFAVMRIVRIDAIVAKSAQLAEFQRWLIDVPGPMRNMWLISWRARFRSTCRISTVGAPGPMRKHVASTIPLNVEHCFRVYFPTHNVGSTGSFT